MASYTKLLQFSKEVTQEIIERDKTCIFCQMGYRMEAFNPNKLDCIVHDIMHFIPRSKLGLGIPQNGAFACRYHHHMCDNGKGGHRKGMLNILEKYLKNIYPDWDKRKLVYRKYEK
jgi:hypothetical protein